ncbi:hypothetical protein Tco_1167209 [Tanacetum coccineum]
MGDEHLSTFSNEEIVPIPRESKDTSRSDSDKCTEISNITRKPSKKGQARTRESEEYKKKPKNQSRSQKSQASGSNSQSIMVWISQKSQENSQKRANTDTRIRRVQSRSLCPQFDPTTTIDDQMIEEMIG